MLSERKWIHGGDIVVHDGLERVHIDAIAGVVCEGYHYIDRAMEYCSTMVVTEIQ